MSNELGTPILDELKICYSAEPELLNMLQKVEDGASQDFGDFAFRRTTNKHFQYAFDVICVCSSGAQRTASARFGRYGEIGSSYLFFSVENYVLYNADLLAATLQIPEQLGMTFHNFTSLDIAIDTHFDVAHLMKRIWHRQDITTIINGKAIRDRKEVISGLSLVYSTTLERVKALTVYVKQRKAAHDKTKGVTVAAYNKIAEIENVSHKEYIREFYGCPKRLYRLEVHLNNAEISDYCKSIRRAQEEQMVFDSGFLKNAFYYHLSSVIRYTKGRHKIAWDDIIRCNGRI